MSKVTENHLRRWIEIEVAAKAAAPESDEVKRIEIALAKAVKAHYRAVACDIDGTLTRRGEVLPDGAAIDALRRLLRQGVPVFLVTGRGNSAGTLVHTLLHALGHDTISQRFFNRLTCLVDNGATAIRPSPDDPNGVVIEELFRLKDPQTMRRLVMDSMDDSQRMTFRGFSAKATRVRLEFSDKDCRDQVFASLDVIAAKEVDLLGDVWLSKGTYRGRTFTIDISPTTKAVSLADQCRKMGIDPDLCARFGDEAMPGGNDHQMLETFGGFSVEDVSTTPGACHVVVDEHGRRLRNSDGVACALSHLSFAAPLARMSPDRREVARQLVEFEHEASVVGKKEFEKTASDFASSLSSLIVPDRRIQAEQDIMWDVYDRRSGAVRLSNWETIGPHVLEPLGELFCLEQFDFSQRSPRSEWSMYSDTSVLLRGPSYYPDWTREWFADQAPVTRILEDYGRFVGQAMTGVAVQMESFPTVERAKLLLGVMDNVRDILLKLLHFAFALHSELDCGPDVSLIGDIAPLVSMHSSIMVRLHIDNDKSWAELHSDYYDFLSTVNATLASIHSTLEDNEVTYVDRGLRLFRSRECDCFVENLTGCRVGLEKHFSQHWRDAPAGFAVFGLVYGGIELPFLSEAIGLITGNRVVPGLTLATSYTRSDRSADPQYSDIKDPSLNYWLQGDHRSEKLPVLLADDNMTTARSLQNARDGVMDCGFDEVVGAIIIRYPGVNRLVQMADIDQSVPDPDVFMGFVRGLVSPAPYARLVDRLFDGKEQYLDATRLFNLSNSRIQRYLSKHLIHEGADQGSCWACGASVEFAWPPASSPDGKEIT